MEMRWDMGKGRKGGGRMERLERTFGRGHDAARARVGLDRHAQGARERLEDRLALVVRVVAAQVVDVNRGLRVVHEALEELMREVHVEVAHARAAEIHV